MNWIITATLLLSVLKAALCFNIDPAAWRTFSNSAAGFGHQVVQRRDNLLVSAPLAQYSANGKGEIYSCTISNANCRKIQPQTVPSFAVNTSLGLTMAYDTNNVLACGPTIPKDCKSITMYNGVCYQIDSNNRFGSPIPNTLDECPIQADIAFLLDGSGSVDGGDFQTMKNFVKSLIKSFLAGDTQFSVSQFSNRRTVHYYFNDFFRFPSWETNIDRIAQLDGGTYTATAIKYVVNNVFTQSKGSRPNVKKVLIVITDGESQERNSLPDAASLADQKNIVRFAIGVGNAFNKQRAVEELNTIASKPSNEHVFQVGSFNALDAIKKNLQDRIFSIEGSQATGESLKMEMSQQGFSAAFVPGGYLLGVVGANGWRGGYIKHRSAAFPYTPESMEPDSYLGYSMAVAQTNKGSVIIVGAPRYQHRGAVTVFYKEKTETINPYAFQTQFPTGAYFGAVVCSMLLDYDSYTDLILISAPMYMEPDREGRVYVCTVSNGNVDCHLDSSPLILRGEASEQGRFGASLAVLPDLNIDGLKDLAVGAPLENGGQGSIYIFQGEGGMKISSTFSQRIAASEVQSGLKFFGMSISQSTFDQSGDQLPDIAVGSKGKVVLLRSRPLVNVEASVVYSPPKIPTPTDCSKALEHTAVVCVTMTRLSGWSRVTANINLNLTLDANRKIPNNRAYFSEKQKRDMTHTIAVQENIRPCWSVKFYIEACQEDVLNPLSNELRFTFEGRPLDSNFRPSLSQRVQTATFHPLPFEINCGIDNKCVDNLMLDFNFTNSSVVKVGIDELLNVTVFVENRGENSYNSRVILTYPAGLSYRKVTSLQGKIQCSSLDSEDYIKRGETDCTVDRPIFKGNTKALFIVSYGIDVNTQLERRIFVTANATSGNQDHSPSSQLSKSMEIPVKYSISVSTESSPSYTNFTFGKNNLKKPFEQSIKITNEIRELNFTTVIRVPVKLGDKDIWEDLSSFQIQDCIRDIEEAPVIQDFVPQIQKNKSVDCSVARCGVFRCKGSMGRLVSKTYVISANLSSRWIEQIGLQSAKFLLTSTVSLEYDRDQYIFFSTGSNNNPPVRKVEAEVEVYPEPDFTKEIIGGSLGGLAFLALITAGLYKAGFFKSKYQDMMNENAEEGAGGGGPEPEAPVE